MRGKSDRQSNPKTDSSADDLRIGKMMEEFGFRPEAATSTGRALILNLVRSAYGPEAAREFMRQMNLEKNRDLEAHVVMGEFKENALKLRTSIEIQGVGTAETQLSLFDVSGVTNIGSTLDCAVGHPGDDIPGTFLQKEVASSLTCTQIKRTLRPSKVPFWNHDQGGLMADFFARRAARMAALAVALGTATFLTSSKTRASEPEALDVRPHEFVVELRPDIAGDLPKMDSGNDLAALSRRLGFKVLDRVRDEMVLVQADDEVTVRENPFVTRVEPNYVYHTLRLPNDPDLAKTWGLKNIGTPDSKGALGLTGLDIGAEKAWDISTGSKSVIVAVIDSGIDFRHPDLKSQAWVNEKELHGKPGVDDDGNGYVDDINGYNFAGGKGDSTDDNAHGSHCAGTIGAKGNDGRGLVGVNWDVSLMAVKFLDKAGSGTLANAIKAVDYARKMGARIMSNSWGGGKSSDLLKKTIQDADKAGALFVVAAGNEANDNDLQPAYPASYDVPNVLTVAAVDNRGNLASFSNFGVNSVHVAAPGVNIVSTVLGGLYDSYSGTSMATPHVAGVAALLLSHNPNFTNQELKRHIIESARPLYSLKKRVSSGGLVDAFYALSGQAPPSDPNDPSQLKNVTPASISTAHPYQEGAKQEWRIQIPGATKIAVRFGQFETELGYDTVSFFDARGVFVGSMSGKQDAGTTSPLIMGDTVIVKFAPDETNGGYGFDLEAILSE